MPEHEIVLKNCKAPINGKIVKCSIGINGEKISAVKKSLSGEKEINCSKKLVLPGLIDVHVHFREPGMEHKADWRHESKAALHSGVTTAMDMPNNKPSICTAKLLDKKRKLVSKKAGIDFGLHFGVSPEHLGEISKAKNYQALKVFMGSSTGNLLVDKKEDQKKAFSLAVKENKRVMVHAEDEKTIQKNTIQAKEKNWNNVKFHSTVRPSEAEARAVRQALELRAEQDNKLHFCHVSSEKSIPLIAKAKQKTNRVSAGVTPHHLFLAEQDLKELKNFGKVNPPIRSKKNRKTLWNALMNGVIDLIETDHAPHTREEKEKDYFNAPSGLPELDTLLPLLLDAFNKNLVSIQRIVECCCENPARIFGVKKKGFIKEGFDADLVVVDLKKEWKVNSQNLFTKCGWSPFEGRKLKGFVEKTLLRGSLRYDSGEIFSGKGKELEVI